MHTVITYGLWPIDWVAVTRAVREQHFWELPHSILYVQYYQSGWCPTEWIQTHPGMPTWMLIMTVWFRRNWGRIHIEQWVRSMTSIFTGMEASPTRCSYGYSTVSSPWCHSMADTSMHSLHAFLCTYSDLKMHLQIRHSVHPITETWTHLESWQQGFQGSPDQAHTLTWLMEWAL